MKKVAIVCVDDEKIILDSLRIQLQSNFGSDLLYEFAESGEEALEIIQEIREKGIQFIVVVSDWLMPGIKGDELLIEIANKYSNVINIMLTGQADQESIDNAIKNANLLECITKPWTEEKLIKTIRKGLKILNVFINVSKISGN